MRFAVLFLLSIFVVTVMGAPGQTPSNGTRRRFPWTGLPRDCMPYMRCFINPCMRHVCPAGTTCRNCNCMARCLT